MTIEAKNPCYLSNIVAVANIVNRKLADLPPNSAAVRVRKIVNSNDLVFGVWQDAAEPDNVGTLIVRGEPVLRFIMDSRVAERFQWSVVPCVCAEQAYALRTVIAEGW